MCETTDQHDVADVAEFTRYLYVQRPRCPECGGARLLAYRSLRQGDGSTIRYVRCSDCGRRVILVVE